MTTSTVDRSRYRLIVRQNDEPQNPREFTDATVGTIVMLRHPRYFLPREAEPELLEEIDTRLSDSDYGATAAERVASLTQWLTTEHGATVVLPVWFYDHSELHFAAAEANPFPDPGFDSGLAGVIFDSPAARERTGVPADKIEQALAAEVQHYDAYGRNMIFEYVIEERDDNGTWETYESGTYYDHTEARRGGEQAWRELVGPLYTEVEPLGPTDNGNSGGDAQLSTAWGRRFVRPLTDGLHFGVVDVEYYVVNANPDSPAEVKIEHTIAYTVCWDPTDPGGTEEQSYTRYPEVPRAEGDPLPTDDDCYRLCAEFDPATLDWDGEYVA